LVSFFVTLFLRQLRVPLQSPSSHICRTPRIGTRQLSASRRGHALCKNSNAPCQTSVEGFALRMFGLLNACYTFSTISHTPQGQTPAQKPQPMHLLSSTAYSKDLFGNFLRVMAP